MFNRIAAYVLGAFRKDDPDTSKLAGSQDFAKLSDRVLCVIQGGYYGPRADGWTGREIAYALAVPLNSVTPRLAPLRRAGLIKDRGIRRDKQTAWIACEPEEKDWNE